MNSNTWTVADVRSGHVVYHEGKYVAWIPGEILSGGYQQSDYVLYPKFFIKWRAPYAHKLIEQSKKEEIIQRVCEGLKKKGLKVEVKW